MFEHTHSVHPFLKKFITYNQRTEKQQQKIEYSKFGGKTFIYCIYIFDQKKS